MAGITISGRWHVSKLDIPSGERLCESLNWGSLWDSLAEWFGCSGCFRASNLHSPPQLPPHRPHPHPRPEPLPWRLNIWEITEHICRDPCAGSREKDWEGARACYRNSMEKEAPEQGDAAVMWAFPSPHKKGSWQAGMSGWVTPTAVKRAYGRVGSNWNGCVKFFTLQRECWCLQKGSWGAFCLGPKELGWQAHACPRWVPAVMTCSQKWANHGVLAVIFILRYRLMWVPDSWGRNPSNSQREAGLGQSRGCHGSTPGRQSPGTPDLRGINKQAPTRTLKHWAGVSNLLSMCQNCQ